MQQTFIFFIFSSEKATFRGEFVVFPSRNTHSSSGNTHFSEGKGAVFAGENRFLEGISRKNDDQSWRKTSQTRARLEDFIFLADENYMRAQASFHEILEEKLQNQDRPQPGASENRSYQDPAHLAYLLGTLGTTYFRPQTTKIYPVQPKPSPRPHALSQAQEGAYAFFNLYGAELPGAFTQKELKRAFRALALKLHPDMNKGTVGPFIELKKNYETLKLHFS